jgi:hypothetical protein
VKSSSSVTGERPPCKPPSIGTPPFSFSELNTDLLPTAARRIALGQEALDDVDLSRMPPAIQEAAMATLRTAQNRDLSVVDKFETVRQLKLRHIDAHVQKAGKRPGETAVG